MVTEEQHPRRAEGPAQVRHAVDDEPLRGGAKQPAALSGDDLGASGESVVVGGE